MRCVVLTPELLTRMSIEPISVSAWATADLMRIVVGDVELDHMGVTAVALDLGAQLLEFFQAATGQHDARTGRCQRPRELRAQAAGGPGDEGHAAGKIDVVCH